MMFMMCVCVWCYRWVVKQDEDRVFQSLLEIAGLPKVRLERAIKMRLW